MKVLYGLLIITAGWMLIQNTKAEILPHHTAMIVAKNLNR